MKTFVTYKISEKSYWLVGDNAQRTRMGKSEFVDLLIEKFADKLNNEEEVLKDLAKSIEENEYKSEMFDENCIPDENDWTENGKEEV